MSFTGVFGEIIGLVVGLYVANSIPSWNIPVIIPDRYLLYLPYANAAIIGTFFIKVFMYISPWYRLKMIFEMMSQLIGIFSIYMLLKIFPFDFTPINRVHINGVLQFAFAIALIALCIAFLVTLVRFITGKST